MWLNFGDPTIQNLNKTHFNDEYVVIPEEHPEGSWVYLFIEGRNLTTDLNAIKGVPTAHPVGQPRQIQSHLHC